MNDEAGYKWLRGVVRGEMARQQITYKELLDRLNKIGVEDTENNLRNKIGRGRFSALLFIQCLEVLGVQELPLTMLEDIDPDFARPMRRKSTRFAPPTEPFVEQMVEEIEDMQERDQEE